MTSRRMKRTKTPMTILNLPLQDDPSCSMTFCSFPRTTKLGNISACRQLAKHGSFRGSCQCWFEHAIQPVVSVLSNRLTVIKNIPNPVWPSSAWMQEVCDGGGLPHQYFVCRVVVLCCLPRRTARQSMIPTFIECQTCPGQGDGLSFWMIWLIANYLLLEQCSGGKILFRSIHNLPSFIQVCWKQVCKKLCYLLISRLENCRSQFPTINLSFKRTTPLFFPYYSTSSPANIHLLLVALGLKQSWLQWEVLHTTTYPFFSSGTWRVTSLQIMQVTGGMKKWLPFRNPIVYQKSYSRA